jgi:16S rRNA (cytidine1402-2'-O)-methyltransferase
MAGSPEATGEGALVLVGTPLGNRDDLSPRARKTILEADLLLCEDTRSPTRLLGAEERLPPRMSCFVGNEGSRVSLMLEHLERGDTVVFVSEAGMPVWSDPGRALVEAALSSGYRVDVVPGPTAAATALVLSGLPAEGTRFVGFLPREGATRRRALDRLVDETATVILYEAGNRVPALLADLVGVLRDAGTRRIVVARELTKLHQETLRGSVAELATRIDAPLRGEVTVVLGPSTTEPIDRARDAARATLDVVLADLKPREKAKRLAALTGLDARGLYDRLRKPNP